MAVGGEYSCMYISAAAMFRHMRLHQKRKKGEHLSIETHSFSGYVTGSCL